MRRGSLMFIEITSDNIHTSICNERHKRSNGCTYMKRRGHSQYINADIQAQEIQRVIN